MYRHWHFFENQKNSSCFHQINMFWNFICCIKFHFDFLIFSILIHSIFIVCSLFFDVFDFIRSFLYLKHINDYFAVSWSLNLKKKEKENWNVKKSIINEKKMMINLIRLTCIKWSFEMTVYWNVEMIICWNVDWLLFLKFFAEIAYVNDMKMILIEMLMIDVFFLKKNLIKWMCIKIDQRFFDDVKKIVQINVMLLSDYEADLTDKLLMSKMFASDVDVIRCTDDWMWC